MCGWAISQKLSVHNFNCVENKTHLNKDFLEIYNENSGEGYFLCFLPERMKTEKIEKLVANLHN